MFKEPKRTMAFLNPKVETDTHTHVVVEEVGVYHRFDFSMKDLRGEYL